MTTLQQVRNAVFIFPRLSLYMCMNPTHLACDGDSSRRKARHLGEAHWRRGPKTLEIRGVQLMRMTVATAVACLLGVGISTAHDAQAAIKQDTTIPAQALGAALKQLASQRDIQLVYRSEVVGERQTSGAVGELTFDEALAKLLRGTGLTYQYIDDQAITIVPMSSSAQESGLRAQAASDVWQRFRLAQAEQGATLSTGASAEAPERRVTLEEVIVTAQKREERLSDVPMSITALSREKLSDARISNAMDLSFVVPSLSVQETGPGRQIISIRGTSGYRGNSSLIGVYLDEVPLSGTQDGFIAAYADTRVLDLERVEVLKGPQGTLFGEGSVGGAIRFVTRDPDLNRSGGEISTEVTNTSDGDWSEKVVGVGNLPLMEDLFGIRVAATYENASGWIDQPSIDRENINDSEMWHVRAKALYTPTPKLEIKGLVEVHRNKGGASNIVNQLPLEDSIFLQGPVRDLPTDFRDDYDLYNLSINYDFGFAELLSSTSYEKFDSAQSFTQMVGTLPTPLFQVALPGLGHDAEIFAQELRLTSTADGPFKWTLGGSYKDDELLRAWGPQGFNIGLPSGAQLLGVLAGVEDTLEAESWAVFGDASYRFFDRLEIGGGVRYFSDDRAIFDQTGAVPITQSASFDRFTWRLYVRYDVTEDVNLYSTVGTGFRSGGFNGNLNIQLGAPVSFGEENSIFYEAGTKMSLLEGRLLLNVAAFYGEYEDMLQDVSRQSPVNPSLNIQYTSNGQSAEIRGVEAELSWLATDRLTLSLAGDVTDAEITSVDPTNSVFEVGDPVDRVPDYTVSASADYRFHWTQSMPGHFLVSFNRKGEQVETNRDLYLRNFTFTPVHTTPPVSFLNASLGAEWSGWDWRVFGTNLLDERGLLFPAAQGWTAQARPRTFGVSVHKQF